MANLDTLIINIENLFETGKILDGNRLSTFLNTLGSSFASKFKEYSEERKSNLYLSNVGKPLRQLWFDISSGLKPESLTSDTKFKFIFGDILEVFVIFLAIEAGHEVTDLQKRVEIDGVRGKIDCRIDGIIVDAKSCSPISFRKFKDRSLLKPGNDPFGYVGQLSGYAKAENEDQAAFLAIDKQNGHLCLLKLEKETIEQYNIRQRISVARSALDRKDPPPELCYEPIPDGKSGNYRLPTGCSYCNHKFNCHPEIRTFIYSNGPVYLTTVIREPQVFELINKNKKEINN